MNINKVTFRFEKDYSCREIVAMGNFNNRHDFTYKINGNEIEFQSAGQTVAGPGAYGAEENMMHDTFLEIQEWEIQDDKLFLKDKNGEVLIKCQTDDNNPALKGSEWSVFWVDESPENVQLRINNTLIRKVK